MKTIENRSEPESLEQPIGPFENELLGAMEEMDTAYAAWSLQKNELTQFYERLLAVYLHEGVEIDIRDRDTRKAPYLHGVTVSMGNARGTSLFRISRAPVVALSDSGDPSTSYWTCYVRPISKTTGNAMSARTNSVSRPDGLDCALRGAVWHGGLPDETAQDERDRFVRFVAATELLMNIQPTNPEEKHA